MLSLSSTTVKSTTDIYLKEQAELLLRSATEYALLALSGHNHASNCLQNITITYPSSVPSQVTHEANVTIMYIGNGINCPGNVLSNSLTLPADANLTTIIDTVVTVNQANTGITEPIRLHRRTIQKP